MANRSTKPATVRMSRYQKISSWVICLVGLLTAASLLIAADGGKDSVWTQAGEGFSFAQFEAPQKSTLGDSRIDVVRIDPNRYRLEVKMASATKEPNLTAPEWARKYNLLAVINAGMYLEDQRTHVGYLKSGDHVNTERSVSKYLSVAGYDPVDTAMAPFRILDLDTLSLGWVKERYRTVIQNLRLIKRPGVNVWSPQERMWTEAALGEDKQGNILLIFCGEPYSMHDLNDILLKLPIDLVAAQHLEGGPIASLYVSHAGVSIQRAGSYGSDETSDDDDRFWPLPNVIGIVKR